MTVLLVLLVGLAAGGCIGWLLRASRPSPASAAALQDLRAQVQAREAELAGLRERASKAAAAEAAATALRASSEAALAEAKLAAAADRAQLETARGRAGELEAQARGLEARLAEERKQIATLQESFRREFESVSNKLLVENAARFGQQSTEGLDKLLAPLRQSLSEFRSSLEATRKETGENSALLKDQVSRISREAASLAQALKGDVKVLGNWGELMLDQILEKSGLQRDLHYRRQLPAKGVDGEQQFLDVVVDLPENRHLIIDSKVSVRSYEEAANTADEAARGALLDLHVESLRRHAKGLGARRYPESAGLQSPDFVLMYVPVEAAYFAAVSRSPGLFAEALDNQVVITTNSTLLATLRTVAHVWRLVEQQRNTLDIAERGGRLLDKFAGFVEDLEAVGAALGKARTAWDAASGKLSTGPGNLVRQAEQLKLLGVKASKAIPAPALQRSAEDGEQG